MHNLGTNQRVNFWNCRTKPEKAFLIHSWGIDVLFVKIIQYLNIRMKIQCFSHRNQTAIFPSLFVPSVLKCRRCTANQWQPQLNATMSSYCFRTTFSSSSKYNRLIDWSLSGTQQGAPTSSLESLSACMMERTVAWFVALRFPPRGNGQEPLQW